jgi:hypothetical protein
MAYRLKLVFTIADRLHFLILRISVERRVTTKKEIRDNSDSPDIDGFAVARLFEDLGLAVSSALSQGKLTHCHVSWSLVILALSD